jgi:hypothetical protein
MFVVIVAFLFLVLSLFTAHGNRRHFMFNNLLPCAPVYLLWFYFAAGFLPCKVLHSARGSTDCFHFSLASSNQRISPPTTRYGGHFGGWNGQESARDLTHDIASRQVIVVVGQDGLKRKCLGG